MPALKQIVYVSRATGADPLRDACDIIRTAHNRNSRDRITGAMILVERHFLQILEGHPWRLDACFERIARDPRHGDIEVRRTMLLDVRRFPDDWMALRHDEAVGAALRERFGYRTGLPSERMSPERLLDFAEACCLETGLDETG